MHVIFNPHVNKLVTKVLDIWTKFAYIIYTSCKSKILSSVMQCHPSQYSFIMIRKLANELS